MCSWKIGCRTWLSLDALQGVTQSVFSNGYAIVFDRDYRALVIPSTLNIKEQIGSIDTPCAMWIVFISRPI
jgi:hypothetical protein